MSKTTYDLLVIGAGPGGSELAFTANQNGANVALVERHRLGGTCLNYGCDPTKTLLHIANLIYQAQQSARFGVKIPQISFDWAAVMGYMEGALNTMRGGNEAQARAGMRERGIDLYIDEAKFVSPHEVALSDQTLSAKRIVIAVGGETDVPPIEGLREVGFITNVEATWLPNLPQRLAVLGGGPLGIEFSQIFNRFGTDVTVLENSSLILNTEDQALARKLCALLTDEGVALETGVKAQHVEQTDKGKKIVYQNSSGETVELVVDEILVSTGRRSNHTQLNLAAAGVTANEEGVIVDDKLRTNVSHIWAIGDVVGGKFTHVANEHAKYLARTIFDEAPEPLDDTVIPWAVYTNPSLAHVGKTEEALKEAGHDYRVAEISLDKNPRAIAEDIGDGIIKLLVDPKGNILGGHILAPHAADLLGPVVMAMKHKLTLHKLAETVFPYPTLVEAIQHAAREGLD